MKYFAKLVLGESPYSELKGYVLVSGTKEFNNRVEAENWFMNEYKRSILNTNLKGKSSLYEENKIEVISWLTM